MGRRRRWLEQAARSRQRGVIELGRELRDRLAEQLEAALAHAGSAGMPQTQLQQLLGRNVPGERIDAALAQLADSGRARSARVQGTRGRPARRWHAITC